MPEIILASSSETRTTLLRNAGLSVEAIPSRIDEAEIKRALQAEEMSARDIADALAEAKARKVAGRGASQLVLGCDQILELNKKVYSKPADKTDALSQLFELRGQTHRLWSASVIYENGEPVWRYVGKADLTMRTASDGYLQEYVERNWDSLRHSVGAYKLEEEGVRLFTQIKGDYFTILGLPLLEILSWLTLRGTLQA